MTAHAGSAELQVEATGNRNANLALANGFSNEWDVTSRPGPGPCLPRSRCRMGHFPLRKAAKSSTSRSVTVGHLRPRNPIFVLGEGPCFQTAAAN